MKPDTRHLKSKDSENQFLVMRLSAKIAEALGNLPDKPGCYIMRDKRGSIIYVGKAASLRKRVRSYFRDATFRRADPKLRGLIKSTTDIELVLARTEAEAVLTEARLIKEYRPRYNVDFRDDKRFLMISVDLATDFPVFGLCRMQKDDGHSYYGPYASSAAARAAVDFIEKRFGLRKCRPRIPGPADHEHCINDIVRYCSAPCIGKTLGPEYAERVEAACGFLKGEKPELLGEVKMRMQEASASLDFERATALRDLLFRLSDISRNRAKVLRTPEMRRDEALRGVKEIAVVLGMENTPEIIEAYDISNISGTYAVGSMVCAVRGVPQRNRYRRFRIRMAAQVDDVGMMRELVARSFATRAAQGGGSIRQTDDERTEKRRGIAQRRKDRQGECRLRKRSFASWRENEIGSNQASQPVAASAAQAERQRYPDLVLVDGGAGQASAARKELRKLGLGTLPVVGLAKQYEELHIENRRTPLRLPSGTPGLLVLQRIRDEAHRFALDYHRQLRSKVVRESVLDDIVGIGPSRKKVLLRHFGSIKRLMRATEEEIAAVPGFGGVMAKNVREALGPIMQPPMNADERR